MKVGILLVSPIATIVWKGLFFFCLSFFALEAFLDINPTNVRVIGTTFSVSYYVYLTAYDLVRFFPAGFAFLLVGAILFAASKYKLVPLAMAGFAVSFYLEVVRSISLMNYYKDTYACHFVSSGPNTGYYCPLDDMVAGRPNIPLQGDVVGFIAFVVAVISFMLWRLRSSIKLAFVDMFLMASGIICIFETLIYYWQHAWFLQTVTYFQHEIYLGDLTNEYLLGIGLAVFGTAMLIRFWLTHKQKSPEEMTIPPATQSSAQ